MKQIIQLDYVNQICELSSMLYSQTNSHDHSAATQVVPITRNPLQEKLLGAHLKKGGDSGLLVPLVLNKHSLPGEQDKKIPKENGVKRGDSYLT